MLRQALAPEETKAVTEHQTLAEHLGHLVVNAHAELPLLPLDQRINV